MEKFSDINAQAVVDEMCAEYRKIDTLLCYPEHGLPDSNQWYTDCNCRPPIFHMKRFFRNIAALDKYEAVIERLDPFFIAVEYFTGKVHLSRSVEPALTKTFTDNFFSLILADSFRSSLDIYAKFVGWFFDLNSKETMGFGYKSLIVPLRAHSTRLADECNALRTSQSFVLLKSLRDVEKHEGHGKTHMVFEETTKTFRMELKRPEPINMADVERAVCACLASLQGLLRATSEELARWPLGYSSPLDKIAEIDDEGCFRMPKADSETE